MKHELNNQKNVKPIESDEEEPVQDESNKDGLVQNESDKEEFAQDESSEDDQDESYEEEVVQEESNEDAPGDDLDVGDVDLGMRLVLFEQLVAEPADVGQSEDEGRADDAVNAPLRASLPQERSDTQPGLDVAHFVQAEMRDF